MDRRAFVRGSIAAGLLGHPLASLAADLKAADMHSHWGMAAWGGNGELNAGDGLRNEMTDAGILLVAMSVVADFPQLMLRGGSPVGQEYAAPGVLRSYGLAKIQQVVARARKDGLVVVGTGADLKAVVSEKKPGITVAVEGGDFLEGKVETLEEVRAMGVCHLQPVHYRLMEVGDISTQAPKYNGLSAFGKDVVKACNRLGILVDVAHLSPAGIAHAIEASTKPLLYSHGFITVKEPPVHTANNARAIHVSQAKEIAAKGGVLGLFPIFTRNPEGFADALKRSVDLVGANHVGIGTDHSGIPRSALSGYEDFPKIAEALSKAGLKDAEVDAVMGGNYIRVLQEALAT